MEILALPLIVILILALPLLLDPGAVDRVIGRTQRPPKDAPGRRKK